ncbi:threonine/serine exporter family protein [Viridibacillus sp. NPDC093762]|uniref:threonine/serine exporter family protein n=1 Tax=Viridibacillus sp. NPDC093762 TaxID=3390720 RepID=UPI003CFDAE7D
MFWVTQGVLSFLATAGFGIIFNAPKKTLFHCGLVGAIGWLIYYSLLKQGVDAVIASFAGSFVISIVAHMLARRFKMPMIIFSVAGIIPLVPGGMAYNAMRHVVENEYLESIQDAAKAFILTGAIVMGLVFAEVFMQLIFNIIRKRKARALQN